MESKVVLWAFVIIVLVMKNWQPGVSALRSLIRTRFAGERAAGADHRRQHRNTDQTSGSYGKDRRISGRIKAKRQ